MVLWTSCPVLWGRQAAEVKTALDSIVDCIKQTEEAYGSYRKGKKALSLITNECIKEVGREIRDRNVLFATLLQLSGYCFTGAQIHFHKLDLG